MNYTASTFPVSSLSERSGDLSAFGGSRFIRLGASCPGVLSGRSRRRRLKSEAEISPPLEDHAQRGCREL
jgi:hypothetical protein